MTDPSYYRQLVTLTYPHIGNVGINSDDFESARIYAAGLIIRNLSQTVSNWRSESSLSEFLARGKTVAINRAVPRLRVVCRAVQQAVCARRSHRGRRDVDARRPSPPGAAVRLAPP